MSNMIMSLESYASIFEHLMATHLIEVGAYNLPLLNHSKSVISSIAFEGINTLSSHMRRV